MDSATPKPTPPELPLAERNANLCQVHLAEYNALTTRLTYAITLQFAVWPIVIGLWGVVAVLAGKVPEPILMWGGVAFSQVCALAWYSLAIETNRVARYIEHDLRPRVKRLVGEDSAFWLWEQRNH